MRKILTPLRVRAMRRLYWVTGINSMCIAKLYGIHPATVFDAVTYRTWPKVRDNFTPDMVVRKDGTE